jgi:hypothetical protein
LSRRLYASEPESNIPLNGDAVAIDATIQGAGFVGEEIRGNACCYPADALLDIDENTVSTVA